MTLQATDKPLVSSDALKGKRILITRVRSQALSLVQRMESVGGEVVQFTTIEIKPPASYKSLDESIKQITSYDWLIFTSVNGVEQFLNRFEKLGKTIADLTGIEVGAIGPETAKKLTAAQVRLSLVAKQ